MGIVPGLVVLPSREDAGSNGARSGGALRLTAAPRFAVIGDIHANEPALVATLRDIEREGVRQVVCLGDLLGYHSFVRETLHIMRSSGIPSVYGNHDLMAMGRADTQNCPVEVVEGMRLARRALTEEDRSYLERLPGVIRLGPEIICSHSIPGNPFERLESSRECEELRWRLRSREPTLRICLMGHSHMPRVVHLSIYGEVSADAGRGDVRLARSGFHFINPGSVGHPRHSDYRASYAIVDREAGMVSFRRVKYRRRRVLVHNRRNGVSLDPGPTVTGFACARYWDSLVRRLRGPRVWRPLPVLWN